MENLKRTYREDPILYLTFFKFDTNCETPCIVYNLDRTKIFEIKYPDYNLQIEIRIQVIRPIKTFTSCSQNYKMP